MARGQNNRRPARWKANFDLCQWDFVFRTSRATLARLPLHCFCGVRATHECLAFCNFCENFGQCPSPSWFIPHLLCLRNARAFPLLSAALASVSFGFVLVRVRVRRRAKTRREDEDEKREEQLLFPFSAQEESSRSWTRITELLNPTTKSLFRFAQRTKPALAALLIPVHLPQFFFLVLFSLVPILAWFSVKW